jgi:hypothetical protein
LGAGEIGYETDTGNFKIGTGAAAWASLAYFNRDPLTTKGDLYTFSTTDARLAVGNSGEQLVADSSATTGLRYVATPSASNPVINSAMQVAQRGTSFAFNGSGGYSLDRWYVNSFPASTISQQATGDTTNLPFIQYCARVQRNVGYTGNNSLSFSQSFETINSIPFAGKTVTVSFYARKGANYSPASSFLDVLLRSGTGTDQNIHGTYTGVATVVSTSVTLTSTWQRFTTSLTGTVASTATELAVTFTSNLLGTAGAADYFEVTGVQIDIGNVALPYRAYAATFQGELSACQRYYYRFTPTGGGKRYTASGFATDTTNAAITMIFPVPMRIEPTALEQSGTATDYSINVAGFTHICTSVPVFTIASTTTCLITFSATALLVAGDGAAGRPVNTNAYLGWSAEL